jgi:hypothetical protein
MNVCDGNINRVSIKQSSVIGVDDSLHYFVFNVGFAAGVTAHLQCAQKGEVKGATPGTRNRCYEQAQFPKYLGQVHGIPQITPFVCLAATAQFSIRITPPDISPQSLSVIPGLEPCLAQAVTDQLIVDHQNLLQNPKHQIVPKLLQPAENLVGRHSHELDA